MSTKEQILNLVHEVEDQDVLDQIYEVLYSITKTENGEIWSSLSDDQKEQVNHSYEQSKDNSKLISNDEAKKILEQWL